LWNFKLEKRKKKSKKKKGTIHPNWEGVEFKLPILNPGDNLVINVKDYDLIGSNDLMGSVTIPLSGISRGREVISTYRLEGGELGENIKQKAHEVKNEVASGVVSEVAGKQAGGLFTKLARTGDFKGNPGVICIGLTL